MKIARNPFYLEQQFFGSHPKSELPQEKVEERAPYFLANEESAVRQDHRAWAAEYALALSQFRQGGREKIEQMNGPLFRQTQEAIVRGFFLPSGQRCEVDRNGYQAMLQKTRFVDPFAAPFPGPRSYQTDIQIRNQSTFQATRALVEEGFRPLVLDMANKRDIGGAPERASAQEETVCRQSTLYPALASLPNDLSHHYSEEISNRFFRGGGVLVPGVQFFRTDPTDGYAFLPPFAADVFASAAYNCNRSHGPGYDRPQDEQEYIEGTKERIRTMLRTAVENGNDSLVLSAFGCGAFKNDPRTIANLYKEVLDGEFKGVFRRLVFAIIDSQGTQNCATFQEVFGASRDELARN